MELKRFLLNKEKYFFLEMNRQFSHSLEHPVGEPIMGIVKQVPTEISVWVPLRGSHDKSFLSRMAEITGLTGAALIFYLIASEGSHIFFIQKNLVSVL